ncbi:MAG3450 family membrane protein [[Mycoplasma] mobile]|uniref:MAG3450 family membrane protein n=1 Tax=[Mycoplasma] mobile TaxID=2118 RepID=UPI000314054D|nr:hypothetical protein [[Mycoplasma] mobile]
MAKKTSKKAQRIKIKRSSAWTKSLFLLFFIMIPAILIWFFTSPDFGDNIFGFSFGIFFVISLGFFLYSILIGILFFYFKIVDLQVFYFLIPISFSLVGIYLSYALPIWARFIITVILILSAIPTNFIINLIEDKMVWKVKIKNTMKKNE